MSSTMRFCITTRFVCRSFLISPPFIFYFLFYMNNPRADIHETQALSVDPINHHVLELLNISLEKQSEQTFVAQGTIPRQPEPNTWGPTRSTRKTRPTAEELAQVQVG
jgi:hypothetical protein